MTAALHAQPIAPSVRRQIGQLLALSDPRCGIEDHNRVSTEPGYTCPRCGLNLTAYVDAVPGCWP
jgi:hypothetical protein